MDFACECEPRVVASSSPGVAGRVVSGSLPDDDQRFRRKLRLTARRQFLTTYTDGYRLRSASFTLFALPNDLGHCRLGVTVTRKIGGAVVRNRIKRVVRDIFRRRHCGFRLSLDLVVNAHRSIVERESRELEEEFLSAFRRLERRSR